MKGVFSSRVFKMPTISSATVLPLPLPGAGGTRPEVARVDDALRRNGKDGRIGAFWPRLARSPADDQRNGDQETSTRGTDSATDGGGRRGTGQTGPIASEAGESAPFVAQVIAQDAPKETPLDPFGEATQAYARRAGPEETSLVVDTPFRVDFSV
jgi:hypothetical protein